MRCKIFLMRHAETEDNARGIFSGWRNSKLTSNGVRQAQKIAKQLKNEKIDYAFTTTLSRASDTLKIVLKHHPKAITFIDDRLRERCYGLLQGKSKEKYMQEHPEFQEMVRRGYRGSPPKGESIEMTSKRVMPFLKELLEFMKSHPGNVAISCHGNSMRPLRKYFENLSIKQMCVLENPHDVAMVYSVDIKPIDVKPLTKKSWTSIRLGPHVKLATDSHNVLKKYY